jgi:programmed cell death 6-interacting protein
MLSEMQKDSSSSLARVDHQSKTDDIRPRIVRQSSGIELWTKVEAAMFETVLDEELGKYDKYKKEVQQLENGFNQLLESIKVVTSKLPVPRLISYSVSGEKSSLPCLTE